MVNNDNTPDIVHANSIEKLSARKPNNTDALILPIAIYQFYQINIEKAMLFRQYGKRC